MILSWRQWRNQGGGVETSAPGAAFWGRKLRLECHVTTTKCQMLADASNHDLQKSNDTRWYPVAKSHQDHQGSQREQLQTLVTF